MASTNFSSDPIQLFQFIFDKVCHLLWSANNPDIGNNGLICKFVSNPLMEKDVTACCSLMNSLLVHLFALSPVECARLIGQISNVNQGNARQWANELLLAYLLEIELLCDSTNALIDSVLEHFKPTHKLMKTISVGQISSWIESLQSKIIQLNTTRTVLMDLAERYPIPVVHRAGNHLIPMQGNVTATCINALTVSRDCELVLQTLAWYRDVLQYCIRMNRPSRQWTN